MPKVKRRQGEAPRSATRPTLIAILAHLRGMSASTTPAEALAEFRRLIEFGLKAKGKAR